MSSLPDIDLEPGCQIVWEAINPTTGAPVAGVKVSAITVYAPQAAEGTGTFIGADLALVPGPGA